MKKDWDEVIEAIEALRKEVPSTKTGFIRRALPQIDQALADGVRLKSIWQGFREKGLDVTYKHFVTYLGRVRSQEKRKGRQATKCLEGQATGAGKAEVSVGVPKHDPFANLRRAEAKRTVFNYRGTQDLEELVYGKRKHNEE
jgi:hypothetical protein